jgi:hypothetical protein
MAVARVADASRRPHNTARPYSTGAATILPGVKVVREGRIEPFLDAHPSLSSAALGWAGLAVEDYSLPACVIPQHEHIENFLHVVLRGSVKYEVLTRGKALQFGANPGTTFILPRGTIDELRWAGPTHRIAVAIHPSLLVNALDETAHESDVELAEHWNLTDPHIMAVPLAMKTDLEEAHLRDGCMANRWRMRWRCICSIGTPFAATRRLGTEEVCQDIGSGVCLIILETTWRTISASRNLRRLLV